MTDTTTDISPDIATINLRVEADRTGWTDTAARIEQALTDDPDVIWWSSAYGPTAVPHANTVNDSRTAMDVLRASLVEALTTASQAVRHTEQVLGRSALHDAAEWAQRLQQARGRQEGLAKAIEILNATLRP